MKARDLTDEHVGLTVRISVTTLPMSKASIGHRHSQTMTIGKVEHGSSPRLSERFPPRDVVRITEPGSQFYSVFEPDNDVEVLP